MVAERGVYAEDTAKLIDSEIRRLIGKAEESARQILEDRRHQLDDLTALLLDKEVIDGDELRARLVAAPSGA